MPTLPSGLFLAVDKSSIMPPDTNWFRAPDGHFWHWTPAPESPPPFKPEDVWDAQPATAPVPTTIEEVRQYVRVVIGLPNGNMYWEGDHISDFPSYRELSQDDLEAWNKWVESAEIHQFLQEAIDDCVQQSIANKQASGVAVTKQTSDGRNVKEIVPPSGAVPKLSSIEDDEDQRYARLLNASPEEREAMSDDDVQAIAIELVIRNLKQQGAEIGRFNNRARNVSYGQREPAISYKLDEEWFYVVVNSARFPVKPNPPEDPKAILDEWSELECKGYWVGVSLAHELDPFDPSGENALPLMKGFGVIPRIPPFVSLQELTDSETGE